MKTNFNTYVLFFVFICFCCDVQAQGNPGAGNNASLSVNFDGGLFFDTYAKLEQGIMLSNISVDVVNFTSPDWRMAIDVQQNFRNADGQEASLENFQIEFNNGTNPIESPVYQPVFLNPLEELEILRSPEPLPNGKTKLNFDFRMMAGDHLLMLPNGTYETTIRFMVYEDGNPAEVISTEETFTFIIDYDANDTNQVLLQNNAHLFSFTYSQPGDYIGDYSEFRTRGLKVTTDVARDVLAKASNSFLVSPTSEIPISVLDIYVQKDGVVIGGISELTVADQVLFRTPGDSMEEYDLEFVIPQGSIQENMAPGLYTGYVIFSIIPE